MNVNAAKKIALTISVIAFAIGFSDLRENLLFWLGRPVGAIALIAYFIFMLLEKEYAILDEQNCAAKPATISESKSVLQGDSNKETCAPALTTAHSP
jgi:hypothetical protein